MSAPVPAIATRVEQLGTDITLLRVIGRLDTVGLLALRRGLRELAVTRPWLILDMAGVPECHPRTVMVLNQTQRRLRHHGARLALWHLRSQPRSLFAAPASRQELEIAHGDLAEWVSRRSGNGPTGTPDQSGR
jgi:anti-anti-sigma regulatory factor